MRQRFLDLLVGLAVGGLVGGTFVSVRWQDWMAQTYLLHTADQAAVALALLRGERNLLLERIEKALPNYVLAIESQFSERPERCWVLWQIRKVYEASEQGLPESVREVLNGLPPEHTCLQPQPLAGSSSDGRAPGPEVPDAK